MEGKSQSCPMCNVCIWREDSKGGAPRSFTISCRREIGPAPKTFGVLARLPPRLPPRMGNTPGRDAPRVRFGHRVLEVTPGSPSAEALLIPYLDVIVAINDVQLVGCLWHGPPWRGLLCGRAHAGGHMCVLLCGGAASAAVCVSGVCGLASSRSTS